MVKKYNFDENGLLAGETKVYMKAYTSSAATMQRVNDVVQTVNTKSTDISLPDLGGTPTPNKNSATDITGCSNTGNHSDKSKWLPIIQCGNAGEHCCDVTEFFILINRIINWFLSISGSIAAITFSIAGIKILFNPSKPEQISEGWAMFRKTVIGMIIVLCAWLVVHTVVSALVAPYALRFLGN